MRRFDRSSLDDARFVIEGLIPQAAARVGWMCLLADAMLSADSVHRGSWAVTLFDDKLRLNVGRIETVLFTSAAAMLVLDADRFTDEQLQEINMDPALGRVDNYASVRGTVNVFLPYDLDADELAEARDALLPLVERAASYVRTRTNYAGSHSSGVVEYVAGVTGRQLRQPDHQWQLPTPRRRR